MSEKPLALSTIAPHPEADYDVMRAGMMATPLGRWFLDEFARRAGTPEQTSAAPAPPDDVFTVAERLVDLAWTMRDHGLEVAASGQIEELAKIILQATSLRTPGNRRAQQLGEALRLLETRIEAMLASSAAAARPVAENPVAGKSNAGQPVTENPAPPKSATGRLLTRPEPEPAEFLLEPPLPPRRPLALRPLDTAASVSADTDGELFAPARDEPVAVDAEREPEPALDLQAQLEQQLANELEFEAIPRWSDKHETAATRPPTPPPQAALPPLPTPRALMNDPLAALRALPDEERIALFT